MKRAAIFRAVSRKEQATNEKASLEEQLKSTTNAAQKMGATVVADLCIPGQSRNIHSLEEAARQIGVYQDLIDLCEGRKITHLIVDKVDRLGRHRILTMQIYDLCDRENIYVYDVHTGTLTSPGDDPLPVMIQSYSADRDVRRMSYNMLRGRRKRNTSGKFAGQLNYGYYYVRNDNDERVAVIDEDKARRVRRMVELYLDESGNGAGRIAARLTAQFGEEWATTTVYNILRRIRVYAGQVVFQGQWQDGNHEAIISLEKALAVERERSARAMNKNYGRSSQMFSRMVFCKNCNALMVVKKYRLKSGVNRVSYRCKQCDRVIAETKLKKAMKAWLAEFAKGGKVKAIKQIDPAVEQRRQMGYRLTEIDGALSRLDERYVAGRLTEDRYDKLLEPLEAEKERIEAALEEQVEPPPVTEVTPELAELIILAIDESPYSEVNAQLRRITQITYDPTTKDIEFI